jgi:hypothetical protein
MPRTAAKEWNGRQYPGSDTTPDEALEAIGKLLLAEIPAAIDAVVARRDEWWPA